MSRIISVSALAVVDLHDLLLELNVVTPAQLHAAGVDRARLINRDSTLPVQEQRLDESLLLTLWQLAANNPKIPHIGLVVGQTFNPSMRGILANWLCHCERVGEALAVFHTHIALMNPSERWVVTETTEGVVLEVSFAPNKAYPQAAYERSMSAVLRWGQELTGMPVVPLACEFTFARPAYAQHYAVPFGGNLHFSSGRNSLHLPLEFLQRPICNSDSYLREVIAERALKVWQPLQAQDELLGRVRQLIRENLLTGISAEQVCQALHMSRPTLYRRLKLQGSSFTELLSSVRKDMAHQQLQQGSTLVSVSERLGFKDVSTFYRAYKRWFKQSPGVSRATVVPRKPST